MVAYLYRPRFIAACLLYHVPLQKYDGPSALTPSGIYMPDFFVNTNGMHCIVGAEMPSGSVASACLVLKDFYMMDLHNLNLVEHGKFAFIPLEDDILLDEWMANMTVVIERLQQQAKLVHIV